MVDLLGSGLIRATVGVTGNVLTGTWRVSAVTVRVSAFTLDTNLDVVTVAIAAVHVSVTGLNSLLTLFPTCAILTPIDLPTWPILIPTPLTACTGLLGALGGPFTKPLKSVLPAFQAVIGTWMLDLCFDTFVTTVSRRDERCDDVREEGLRRDVGTDAALHSSLSKKVPMRISLRGFRHFRRNVRIFLR